jgi:pyruvate kinase
MYHKALAKGFNHVYNRRIRNKTIKTRIFMYRNRKTRILATLGPASNTTDIIRQLVLAGADVFRLNASHGTHDDMRMRYDMIRAVEQELSHPIGILLDLQGPKLRIGQMQDGIVLTEGDIFTLDLKTDIAGDNQRAPMPHPEIFSALVTGSRLLINDGKIRLEIIEPHADYAVTRVMVGGALTSRKGVNVPDVELDVSAMTPKDKADLEFALELGVDCHLYSVPKMSVLLRLSSQDVPPLWQKSKNHQPLNIFVKFSRLPMVSWWHEAI